MSDNILLRNALINAFPTASSFTDFKENDRDISRRAIPGIIHFAFKHKIIDRETEEALVDFLEKNAAADSVTPLQEGLTFPDILDILSGNLSVNALIAQLDITAKELSLPEIQAPMITRLKKKFVINTPKKRALLRILAFKLAQKCPDLNWHYEMLLRLPATSITQPEPVHETAGITMTFHLQGQGEIIVPSDVAWLKNELTDCIDYLRLESHVNKKVIETVGATSFSLRSPKKPGPIDEPRLYHESIRNLLSIAHQMAGRWLLSPHSSPQKKLIIVIYAGVTTDAHFAIQRVLEMHLTAESGIYLTDFARLCALYASVKAGFELYHQTPQRSPGYDGDVWALNYFLSYTYYDFIPCLLEGKMLPVSMEDSAFADFKRTLHFPEQAAQHAFGAISAMHRYPQSALLLTEIAKVLSARRMFFEADAVLANLLLSSPQNLVARLMRMLIYSNIAQDQTDPAAAQFAYERAAAEGEYIVENCEPLSDMWHEIGVLNFSRTVKTFQFLDEKTRPAQRVAQHEELLGHLQAARQAFLKGMTVSATGKALNSLYMFGYTICLLDLLDADAKAVSGNRLSSHPANASIFRENAIRVFRNIGWLRDDPDPDSDGLEKTFQNLLLTLNLVIARYENLVLCRSNIPHMKYMFAMILWDFAPVVTPQICLRTLEWLKIARTETQKLLKDNISVYHVATGNISPQAFMDHIKETMELICGRISETDLRQGKDTPELRAGLKELSQIKLLLLEIERTRNEAASLCA
ncbi:MAG TPA: hypothetical protein PK090_08710 [Smithellaceae bacterium]|nr:hypothetical protein [Smithellaceae bacterium]